MEVRDWHIHGSVLIIEVGLSINLSAIFVAVARLPSGAEVKHRAQTLAHPYKEGFFRYIRK
jgi:hypothetical protein